MIDAVRVRLPFWKKAKFSARVSAAKRAVMSALMLVGLSAPAIADTNSEVFIQENISHLLGLLTKISSDPSAEKTASPELAAFEKHIIQIVDFPWTSRFVLGRYGRGLERNVYNRYADEYKTYVQGFYLDNLLKYAGAKIEIKKSIDLKRGDSIVETRILGTQTDKNAILKVDWRVRKQKDGRLKVLDLALTLEGNQLWLAQEQRAQFMSVLDRSNGNVETLIAQLKQQNEQ